jgi:hypothetical protein
MSGKNDDRLEDYHFSDPDRGVLISIGRGGVPGDGSGAGRVPARCSEILSCGEDWFWQWRLSFLPSGKPSKAKQSLHNGA